jgi:hypothetical protein
MVHGFKLRRRKKVAREWWLAEPKLAATMVALNGPPSLRFGAAALLLLRGERRLVRGAGFEPATPSV